MIRDHGGVVCFVVCYHPLMPSHNAVCCGLTRSVLKADPVLTVAVTAMRSKEI